MGMVVRTNTMALNAYRQLGMNNSAVAKSLEKLSSGFRINRAGDDAAGLAISEKMKAQITGLETASSNAQDGISLIQTAEGNLTEVHSMLNRMVELATKSANGTYQNEVDREALQSEMDQLLEEINRISKSANFNGIKLLDGTMGLNKAAFTIGDTVAAVTGQENAGMIMTAMPAAGHSTTETGATGAATILHAAGDEAKKGEVTIDVSGLAATPAAADKTASIKVTINGTDITVAATTAGKALDGKTIAATLATEINKLNTNKGLLVGTADKTGLIYEAKDNGDGTITLTTKYDGAGTALTDGLPTKDTADAALKVNWDIAAVQTSADTHLTIDNNNNIGSTKIDAPVKPTDAAFGNTMLKLDMANIKDGMVLEIAGEKYTFAVGADSAVSGANVIDLKDLDLSKTADQTEAMNRITNAAGNNQTFTVGHNNQGFLTLAEKNDGAGKSTASEEMQKKMETLEGFKSLVKVYNPSTDAGIELTVSADKIVSGDSIRIGDKTYTFGDGNGQIALGTNGADAVTNLTNALKAEGYTVTPDTNDPNKLVISAGAGKDAPAIIGGGLTLQIGDTADSFNKMNVAVADMSAKGLGLDGLQITTASLSSEAIDKIKTAINTVSTARADMGALQNRLEHTINNLDVAVENLSAANSRIRDTDMAKEMMNYTKMNVLVQSAQAMLAQANQQPQSVLQLLQ